ncbi:CPBP family intramembrane glutamic endopeptidase [Marinoscillum sp.]|uniref:CPBP family intramembrane glutamic endopeptidase n=1 Tax=Marinoscillum sp. TaxID=2024838 RepID=UPI003BAD3620
MNWKEIFYASDKRLRTVWRVLLFVGLLVSAVFPLILLEDKTLQFLGAVIILWVGIHLNARLLDKLPVVNYGLQISRKSLIQLLIGLIIGVLAVGLMLVIGLFSETIELTRRKAAMNSNSFLIFTINMLLVAILEESLYRGYLLTTIRSSFNYKNGIKALSTSIFISSVAFGLAHLGNHHASLISVTLLTLNGLVWCIPFVLTRSLGLSIGMHASWNITQSMLGFTMSGNKAGKALFSITNDGNSLINGGEYGPEAGLMGLMGFLIMLGLSYLYIKLTQGSLDLSPRL